MPRAVCGALREGRDRVRAVHAAMHELAHEASLLRLEVLGRVEVLEVAPLLPSRKTWTNEPKEQNAARAKIVRVGTRPAECSGQRQGGARAFQLLAEP